VSIDLAPKVNERRATYVVISLLILQLLLLSLQIEDPSGTLLFKTWVLSTQAPIMDFSSKASGGVRDLWHNYVWLVGARSENERLRETIDQLLLLTSAYEQIREENSRLRRELSLSDVTQFTVVGARVVARAPTFLANVIYIDRGWEDGVGVDAPVVSGNNVVGRTVVVSRRDSQVQLITSPDASVGAMLAQSRTPGVLRGSGNPLIDLNYISNLEEVKVGDPVMSSGLDGVYPKGLVVGKVVDSHKGKSALRSIKVEPRADLVRLEEVSVLLKFEEKAARQ